ncbi:hypothetical protein [Metapseudomonas boanensis]|uniref:Uncharacterized protein n=1 Tax=Metapseudomonas boanensis TaxID=2822138 RepID=A0ABS5XDT1_9GAMM|nr:hypothetical protein [Pseudomonas boanensis]MBT8765825.1 hypothetical protein [Pseudomonas boanensis]
MRFFALLFFASVAFGKDADLCDANEIMIASCFFDEPQRRILSICADKGGEEIFYRFGRKDKVELSTAFSRNKKISRWIDLGTYTTYFGFRVGKYSYIFGIPEEAYGAKAFLKVKKNQDEIMSRECTENTFGEKLMAAPSINDVDDEIIRDSGFIFPPR